MDSEDNSDVGIAALASALFETTAEKLAARTLKKAEQRKINGNKKKEASSKNCCSGNCCSGSFFSGRLDFQYIRGR